jgi:hypothetical protein
LQFTIELDNAYSGLVADYPREVKQAVDTAVLRALHSLSQNIADRESIKTSASSFIGTGK